MNCTNTARTFIRSAGLIDRGHRVLVAVSGGSDSLALLEIMHDLAGPMDLALAVAWFDHGIRPVERDRRIVERRCAALDLALFAGRGNVPKQAARSKAGIEETARRMRYAFLEETATAWEADRIALGHTRNDQVETILHHVIRGAGARGLAGMPALRDRYVRPLLRCDRSELRLLLRDRGIRWAADETNRDNSILRNRIRNLLLPNLRRRYNPAVDDALLRLGENTAELAAVVDDTGDPIPPLLDGAVSLPAESLASRPPFLQYRLIDRILRERFGVVRDVEKVHVDAARRLLDRGRSGRRVELPHGIEVAREGNELIVRLRRTGATAPPPAVTVPGEGEWPLPAWGLVARVERIDPRSRRVAAGDDLLVTTRPRFPLTIRPRRRGDRLRPFGMEGTRRLGRIMIDRKVPLSRRDRLPVFADRGGILWVPGVVAAERTRVPANARFAWTIALEPDSPRLQ